MAKVLTRDAFNQVSDYRTEDVPVPEWGADVVVRIKTLSVKEHGEFTGRLGDKEDDASVSAHLTIATAINEDGSPLFTADDLANLQSKSASAIKRIGKAASKLNGLGKSAEDDRKNG